MSQRFYTIPELDELWREIESLRIQIAGLRRNLAPIPSASLRPQKIEGPMNERFLYSKREAAQMLSVCVSTLDQLIARGELKTRRLGKKVMVPRGELVRLAGRDVTAIWPAKQGGKTVRQ
jgi:excisionase family DNA binding protein